MSLMKVMVAIKAPSSKDDAASSVDAAQTIAHVQHSRAD
jgi:hypothetical protein